MSKPTGVHLIFISAHLAHFDAEPVLAIILSLNVAKIISMKIGLSANETEEIVLIPFRFLMKSLAAPSLRTNPHTHT